MTESISDSVEPSNCRLFTIEEANAMLPLVKSITRDIVSLTNDLIDRKHRLDSLGVDSNARSEFYAEELIESEKTMSDDTQRLHALIEELCELGVQPQSLEDGKIAFPTMINDELEYFTWAYGDDEVSSWETHEEKLIKGLPFDSLFDQSKN